MEALNKQNDTLFHVTAQLCVLSSSSGAGRTSEAETKKEAGAEREGKEEAEEEEEKRRSHQIKARGGEEKKLDGSQKAESRCDRRQRRAARTLVRCSSSFPEKNVQRADSWSHSPSGKLHRNVLMEGRENERKKHMCIS